MSLLYKISKQCIDWFLVYLMTCFQLNWCIASSERMVMHNDKKACVIAYFGYYLGNCIDVLRKTTKNLRIIGYRTKNQNLVLPKYKAEVQGSHLRDFWKSFGQVGKRDTGYSHQLHCTCSNSWHSLQATRLTDHIRCQKWPLLLHMLSLHLHKIFTFTHRKFRHKCKPETCSLKL
jgi:hypothetical protein